MINANDDPSIEFAQYVDADHRTRNAPVPGDIELLDFATHQLELQVAPYEALHPEVKGDAPLSDAFAHAIDGCGMLENGDEQLRQLGAKYGFIQVAATLNGAIFMGNFKLEVALNEQCQLTAVWRFVAPSPAE